MEILFLTEGGRNIGFGHITRCEALSQGFEAKGIRPKFIINGDDSVIDLLPEGRYQIFDWIKERGRLFEQIRKTNVVVIDSYLANLKFYKRLSDLVKVPVYIDDNKRIDYPKGVVINSSIYAEKIGYPASKEIIYLLGSKYIFLRKEFWEINEKEIKEEVKSIMVTFGGDDSKNMTLLVLDFLNQYYPDVIKKVVIGKRFRKIQDLDRLKNSRTFFSYDPDAEGMKNIMIDSDIAISAAGATLYELARVGLPSIVVTVANNQLNNAIGWKNAGYIEYAGYYNDPDLLKNLKSCIEKFTNVGRRIACSKFGRSIVSGQGAKFVAESILEINAGGFN